MMHVEPYRLDSDRYPLKVRIRARYADVDPLGHITNVAVARYCEAARVSTTMMVMGSKRIPSPTDVLVHADEHNAAPLPEAYRQRVEGWLIAAP